MLPPGAAAAETTGPQMWGLRRLQGLPQPNLLLYLLKVFYRHDQGTGEFDREAKAHLFLLLKTVLDSLA